ncbi:hypothetical protein FB45DRAFT_873313 [Roridomyces roridus]|uniref:Uncharacterized protein n=1 Tax=Roridomyces roridus TaxID=1738132 RepID=A0AAD7BBF3_9AGAR|nr:hypothetical protein FB45DRAFT_873313 [Roridomyces roridus]
MRGSVRVNRAGLEQVLGTARGRREESRDSSREGGANLPSTKQIVKAGRVRGARTAESTHAPRRCYQARQHAYRTVSDRVWGTKVGSVLITQTNGEERIPQRPNLHLESITDSLTKVTYEWILRTGGRDMENGKVLDTSSAGRSDNGTQVGVGVRPGMERVSQIGLDWRTMRIGGGPGCRGENSSQLAQGKLECPGGHDYHADQNGAICRTMKIMPRTHMESTQNRRNIEHGIRLETGNQAGMSKGTHQSEKGPGSVALSRLREPSGCRVFLGCLVPVSTALGGGEETHTWYPDRHE